MLQGVEGIRFCHFEDVDVVRHQLVQRIVRAYDSYTRSQIVQPLESGHGSLEPRTGSPLGVPPAVQKPQ